MERQRPKNTEPKIQRKGKQPNNELQNSKQLQKINASVLKKEINPDALTAYLQNTTRYPLLTRQEEQKLAQQIEIGDEEARQRLIECNLRLVVKETTQYYEKASSVPVEDLIEEGNTGLLQAVDKFDYRRGLKFSTHATWWIKQAILRALSKQSRTVRLPEHEIIRERKVRKGKEQNEQEGIDQHLSLQEIANITNLPLSQIADVLSGKTAHAQNIVSFDAALNPDDPRSGTIEDTMQDPSINQEESLLLYEKSQKLQKLLDLLPENYRTVIRMRLGLDDGEEHSLAEIGRILGGISRERVRQIEEAAIRMLRQKALKIPAVIEIFGPPLDLDAKDPD